MIKSKEPITIYLLIILAILTAGISPACKFISGKSNDINIEICTLFGNKTISVSDNNVSSSDKNINIYDQCMFCFFAHFYSAIINTDINLLIYDHKINIVPVLLKDQILSLLNNRLFEARAPPISPI